MMRNNEVDTLATPLKRSDGFKVVVSDRGLGRNFPQRMGRALWLPMWVMAVMAFPVAVILGAIRANLVADGDPADAEAIARLQHVTAAVMFIGFLAVLSAVTFAIARILGEFRAGGGLVQETARVQVQTIKMPVTAKAMLFFMMMGMMLILVPVILHIVAAAAVVGPAESELLDSEQWFLVLEGLRRFGVASFLLGIALGLATIITVVRFQSVRIREVAVESTA
jgi:hypothetical protein